MQPQYARELGQGRLAISAAKGCTRGGGPLKLTPEWPDGVESVVRCKDI